jgi:hypothetical protein
MQQVSAPNVAHCQFRKPISDQGLEQNKSTDLASAASFGIRQVRRHTNNFYCVIGYLNG